MQLPRGHIVVAIEPPDSGSSNSNTGPAPPAAGDGNQAAPLPRPPSSERAPVREDDIKFRIGEDSAGPSSAAAQASSSSSSSAAAAAAGVTAAASVTHSTTPAEVDPDEAPPPYAPYEEEAGAGAAHVRETAVAPAAVPAAAAAPSASPPQTAQPATTEFRPPSGQPSVEWDGPRCPLAPGQMASLQSTKPTVPLSGLAAYVLVSNKILSVDDIIPLQRSTAKRIGPTDPISGAAIVTYRTVRTTLEGVAAGPVEAYKQIKQNHFTPSSSSISSPPMPTPPPSSSSANPSNIVSSSSSSPPPLTPSHSASASSSKQEISPSQLTTVEKVGVGTAAVSVSAAKGVGRIIGAGFKAPVMLTHDAARGFHNVPRLYGDETVREVEEIRSFKDGVRAAGKGFTHGIYDGITGFFLQPVDGARKEGGIGFLKGVGKGMGGLVCKPAAGGLALPGYTLMGAYKEMQKLKGNRGQEGEVVALHLSQGEVEARTLGEQEKEEIINKWRVYKANAEKKKK